MKSKSETPADAQYARKDNLEMSRPTLHRLNILDLPNELLVDIFEILESAKNRAWRPKRRLHDSPDIRHVRLTCRRFCNTSSHLLVSHVRVDLSVASLARLAEIASHPEIRKGVKVVSVQLSFWDARMANDLARFINHTTRNFPTKVFDILSGAPGSKISSLNISKKVQSHPHPDAVRVGSKSNTYLQEVLRDTHEEYRQLHREQESLLRRNAFERAVASAMARMPKACSLEVDDQDVWLRRDRPKSCGKEPKRIVHRNLIRPIRWAFSSQSGCPPMKLLHTLPIICHEAGVHLKSLSIHVTRPESYAVLSSDQVALAKLSLATQHLEYLYFGEDRGGMHGLTSGHFYGSVAPISNYLTTVASGKNLRRVRLEHGHDLERSVALALVRCLPWQNEPNVYMSRLCVHSSELAEFVNPLDKPMKLHFGRVRLVCGSWADAFDMLRQKRLHWSFDGLSGGEVDDLGGFDGSPPVSVTRNGRLGQAEKYIQGLVTLNPIRVACQTRPWFDDLVTELSLGGCANLLH
ncbi:Uu.00g131130.m01.CDS01 [Anthostomella pinea]|uniref:Uu.00g131130.m01.CDS01 n=1 Tax=Anthostomella pinea TaxID=933095 RepID=A0AAI8VIS9_9PEZI|nr:Uu.00g131130.m01.CDS01 [Anthostomella pinea]